MAINYNKLFSLMEAKKIKKYHLRQQGIHAAVMDKLIKNKNVDIITIDRLCKLLDCQPGDILEYIPDDEKETSEAPEQPEEDQAENTASEPVNKNSREYIEGLFTGMSELTEQRKKK